VCDVLVEDDALNDVGLFSSVSRDLAVSGNF